MKHENVDTQQFNLQYLNLVIAYMAKILNSKIFIYS